MTEIKKVPKKMVDIEWDADSDTYVLTVGYERITLTIGELEDLEKEVQRTLLEVSA